MLMGKNIFLDCGNGVKLELVFVEAGSFWMGGSHRTEHGADPGRTVNVSDFFIGKFPVTQQQYVAVIGRNPSKIKELLNPVETVDFNNALSFCQKLSQKTGQKVRLPSEAEWEYAAGDGNQSKGYQYPGGRKSLDEAGWYKDNSGERPHPVGQKNANLLGIYDMSGNICEYTEDIWHDSFHGAPIDGKAWLSGGDQSKRVTKGGCFYFRDEACKVQARYPWYAEDRAGTNNIGFRVVV